MIKTLAASSICALLMMANYAKAENVIVVSAPMSGSLQILGKQISAGVKTRLANGDLQNTRLIEVDDNCSEDGAIKAIETVNNEAKDSQILAVIGLLCSEAAEIWAEQKQVGSLISLNVNSAAYLEKHPSAISFTHAPKAEAEAISHYIDALYADKKIAIISDGTTTGRVKAEEVEELVTVSLNANFAPETGEITELVDQLKASSIDMAIVTGTATNSSQTIKLLQNDDLQIEFIGTSALAKSKNQKWLNSTKIFTPLRLENIQSTQVAQEELKATKYRPEGFALQAYAAVQVIEKSAQTRSIPSRLLIRGTQKDSILGEIKIDENGQASSFKYALNQYVSGMFKEAE